MSAAEELSQSSAYESIHHRFVRSLTWVPPAWVASLRPHFEGLPPDPSLDEKYRFRRYASFALRRGTCERLPRTPGGLECLDERLVREAAFQNAFRWFRSELPWLCSEDTEFGVHQIRVVSHPAFQASRPAPEDLRRARPAAVGILVIQRNGIDGGETRLLGGGQPIFRKLLHEGEFLVFNGELLGHETTEWRHLRESGGFRDVLGFAAQRSPV